MAWLLQCVERAALRGCLAEHGCPVEGCGRVCVGSASVGGGGLHLTSWSDRVAWQEAAAARRQPPLPPHPSRVSPPPRRLVKYVESAPEPFAEGGKDGPNPWTQQVVGAPQCCVVS